MSGRSLQGVARRVVYIALYEAIAIVIVSIGLDAMAEGGLLHAGVLAVMTSVVAVVWNLVFNHAFEWWESRQPVRGRSVARRVAHAIGFEGGLVVLLVPIMAWWLRVSLLQAFLMDVALVVFFLVYTFVFTWAFDRIFGLPASARPA